MIIRMIIDMQKRILGVYDGIIYAFPFHWNDLFTNMNINSYFGYSMDYSRTMTLLSSIFYGQHTSLHLFMQNDDISIRNMIFVGNGFLPTSIVEKRLPTLKY